MTNEILDVDNLHFGLNPDPPEVVERRFKLTDIMTAGVIPATPPTFDFTDKLPSPWYMLGNNQWGDCAFAAAGHHIMAMTNSHGGLVMPSTQAILQGYSECTGFAYTRATDLGTSTQQLFSYWKNTGIPTLTYQAGPVKTPTIDPATGKQEVDANGNLVWTYTPSPIQVWARDRIKAYLGLNLSNQALVQYAVANLGGAYLAVNYPKAWATAKIWDGPPDGLGGTPQWQIIAGHAIYIVGYNPTGPVVITWGRTQQMTWAGMSFFGQYGVVVLSNDIIDPVTLQAPDGLDMAHLNTLLNSLTITP